MSAQSAAFLDLYYNPLLTIDAICRLLKISRATCYRYIKELNRPVLKVGVSRFSSFSSQPFEGFDAEVAHLLSRSLGIRFKLYPKDSMSAVEQVRRGKVDFAVSGITNSSERRRDLSFSYGYLLRDGPHGIVIGPRRLDYHPEGGLLKKRVLGVWRDSLHDYFATKNFSRFIKIKRYSLFRDLEIDLLSGKTDFVLNHTLHSKHLLTDGRFTVKTKPFFYEGDTCIGINPRFEPLVNPINQVLEKNETSILKLQLKYFA